MRFCIFSLIFFLFHCHSAFSKSPKRELRAAWIATVANIDWPSKPGLPSVQQQQEFIRRLDDLQEIGCNAIIVQIRPASDALYPSKMEPWSRYLTGKQGQPPFPAYDPLSFMIAEAHKRNIEFHAWFNPFRALTDSKKNPNPPSHVTRSHPDWIVNYGGKAYINPGIPEAREYVINVIMDVVKRYDIDAVHLDDYFYPYRIAGVSFADDNSYKLYKEGFTNKEDWRRNNVNLFVSTLNGNIKSIKRFVKFGISPFGIWRNLSRDPQGSCTKGGQSCYDDLYADVLEWLRRGWVDYVLPQLYWEHRHRAAAFEVLLPWWEQHAYGRHIYYGLGVYRMVGASSGIWSGTRELLSQIDDIRAASANPGISFYSASSFDKAGKAIRDSLKNSYNKYIAFPPVMPWIDSTAPVAPVLKITASSRGNLLQWTCASHSKEQLLYAVYRFAGNEPIDIDNPAHIVKVQSGLEWLDETPPNKSCTYIITALDRLWNESKPSNEVK